MAWSNAKFVLLMLSFLLLGYDMYQKLQKDFSYSDPLNRFTFSVPGKWIKKTGITFCYKDGTVNFTRSYQLSPKQNLPVLSVLSGDNNTFLDPRSELLPRVVAAIKKEECVYREKPYLHQDGKTCTYDYDPAAKKLIKVMYSPKSPHHPWPAFTSIQYTYVNANGEAHITFQLPSNDFKQYTSLYSKIESTFHFNEPYNIKPCSPAAKGTFKIDRNP